MTRCCSIGYDAAMARAKNQAAAALGKLGGKARAKKLSPEELSKQGRKAALVRWGEKQQAKSEFIARWPANLAATSRFFSGFDR